MKIVKKYSWLSSEPGPKMLQEALKLYGTLEAPGEDDSPTILGWAKELGIERTFTHDSIPWCGLFMAIVAKRAGKDVVKSPLWAANWLNFGVDVKRAMLGDVLVFKRPGGGGHVALYVGEDDNAYHVLGGNQRDAVNVTRILKSRCTGIRRPRYIVQPDNVRVIKLGAEGVISQNEN